MATDTLFGIIALFLAVIFLALLLAMVVTKTLSYQNRHEPQFVVFWDPITNISNWELACCLNVFTDNNEPAIERVRSLHDNAARHFTIVDADGNEFRGNKLDKKTDKQEDTDG